MVHYLASIKDDFFSHVTVFFFQEYKKRLDRVTEVRTELESHIKNLPDFDLLPRLTGGLAPLPSAGDLFNLQLQDGRR
jgi:hypothetical protein